MLDGFVVLECEGVMAFSLCSVLTLKMQLGPVVATVVVVFDKLVGQVGFDLLALGDQVGLGKSLDVDLVGFAVVLDRSLGRLMVVLRMLCLLFVV